MLRRLVNGNGNYVAWRDNDLNHGKTMVASSRRWEQQIRAGTETRDLPQVVPSNDTFGPKEPTAGPRSGRQLESRECIHQTEFSRRSSLLVTLLLLLVTTLVISLSVCKIESTRQTRHRIGATPTSYSGGLGFQCRYRLSCSVLIFVVFLSSSRKT
jgi:hypothetical protein